MLTNMSIYIYIFIWDLNLAFTKPVDALVPDGVRPSADAVLSEKLEFTSLDFSGYQQL